MSMWNRKYFPRSLAQCPSLVWVGTHAMLCATPRVALPERGLQTESVAQRPSEKNCCNCNGKRNGKQLVPFVSSVFHAVHQGHNPHHPHAAHVFLRPKGKNRPRWNLRNLLGRKNSGVASCKSVLQFAIWMIFLPCLPYTGSIETWSFQVRVSEEISGSVCRL